MIRSFAEFALLIVALNLKLLIGCNNLKHKKELWSSCIESNKGKCTMFVDPRHLPTPDER